MHLEYRHLVMNDNVLAEFNLSLKEKFLFFFFGVVIAVINFLKIAFSVLKLLPYSAKYSLPEQSIDAPNENLKNKLRRKFIRADKDLYTTFTEIIKLLRTQRCKHNNAYIEKRCNHFFNNELQPLLVMRESQFFQYKQAQYALKSTDIHYSRPIYKVAAEQRECSTIYFKKMYAVVRKLYTDTSSYYYSARIIDVDGLTKSCCLIKDLSNCLLKHYYIAKKCSGYYGLGSNILPLPIDLQYQFVNHIDVLVFNFKSYLVGATKETLKKYSPIFAKFCIHSYNSLIILSQFSSLIEKNQSIITELNDDIAACITKCINLSKNIQKNITDTNILSDLHKMIDDQNKDLSKKEYLTNTISIPDTEIKNLDSVDPMQFLYDNLALSFN